jgi:hypothetical protein
VDRDLADRLLDSQGASGRFFEEVETNDVWAVSRYQLNFGFIERIHAGPVQTATDVEVAVPLAWVVHDEFLSRGTDDKARISVHEISGGQA